MLKIGEVSKKSGVGIEALRFYERQGIISQPVRTENGYRMYDESVLDELDFIRRAQTLGFSLSDISSIIAERRAGQSPCIAVREIVRSRLRELDERLAEMKRYRRELASTLAEWDTAGDRPGHVCGLIEGSHVAVPTPRDREFARRKAKTPAK
jgi:DNA-binding transcriptional MerR regulator